MKKALAVILALGLVVGALAMPATAKKKKKKAAAPVPVTYYLHGTETAGEVEATNAGSGVFMSMDATKPAAGTPKSMFVTNYFAGPNTACSGNSLLPTWRGPLAGTVKGDVKLRLHTIGSPAAVVQADLFPDGTGGCDSDLGSTGFVPPVSSVQADVPPGPGVTEITFPNVNFKSVGSVLIMLSIPGAPANPYQVRVLYDDATYDSSLELTCTPNAGATACTP
jgi:hypothetical protein